MTVLAFCVGRFFLCFSSVLQVLFLLILCGLLGLSLVLIARYWKRLTRLNETSRLSRAFFSVASEVDEILIVDEAMNIICSKPWARRQSHQASQRNNRPVFSFDAIIRASFADKKGNLEACQKALQQGTYFEDVFEGLKKNARDADCFVRIRIMPLFFTSSSRPSYRVIVFSDVTLYQSRALRAGAESAQAFDSQPVPTSENEIPAKSPFVAFLERSFDRAPFGLALMNAQGILTHVNLALSRWLGAASKRTLIGRSFFGLNEGGLTVKELLETSEDQATGHSMRLRLNRLDPAIDVLVFVTPLSEDQFVLSLFKRSSKRGKEFLDTLPFPSLLLDSRGIPQVINKHLAALLQKKRVDPIKPGQALTNLLDESSQSIWARLFRSNASTGTSSPALSTQFFELRFANVDFAVMGAIKRLDRDQILVQFVDSSEQKKLEQQFFQAQKNQAIGQLAGGIAHDFNNLLTAIIGFCDLLLQRVMPNDPSFSDIMHIKQNANRASNLVKQLLAFSRRQTLQPRRIDVTDMLADLSVLLRRLLGAPVTLRLVRNRETWPVKVDVSQFEQVIINLAVNARDAMAEKGGELTIETSNVTNSVSRNVGSDVLNVGDYVLISLKDTGVGIPEDVMKVMFEPYFSTKPQGKGTGLGLATVYGIVHQTGGAIAVESKVGQGTTFKIFLPRCHDKTSPPTASQILVQDVTGDETILLVEDESTVRLFAARALRDKGYRVLEAASGKAALALVQEGARPDILLTDVSMPEMSGPVLADKIREILPCVPVVFMSGYAAETFRKDLSENQSIHFLSKPFTLRDLATMVRKILEEQKKK